jgi:hypothetical protein
MVRFLLRPGLYIFSSPQPSNRLWDPTSLLPYAGGGGCRKRERQGCEPNPIILFRLVTSYVFATSFNTETTSHGLVACLVPPWPAAYLTLLTVRTSSALCFETLVPP